MCSKDVSYGKTFNIPCSGDCINKTCDMTGNCLHGCNNSKYGIECDKDCEEGCRLCHDAFSCSKCENGWVGLPCQQRPKTCKMCWSIQHISSLIGLEKVSFHSNQSRDTTAAIQIFIGLNLGLLAAVIVSTVLYRYIYRHIHLKRKRKGQGLNINRADAEDEENYGLSVYNVRGSQALLTELDPEEELVDTPVSNIRNHNYLNVKISRIFVNSLWEFKLQNQANEYMADEFWDLPGGLLLECGEAKKSKNRKRNRYKDVYPYDTTRVVLSVEADYSSLDYINACYVNGHEKPREYIAAQAPFTDDTIVDFWRMVWQSNVNTIVILTNLEENNIMKCKQYWPTNENKYGDVLVSTIERESSVFFKIRRFKIFRETEERTLEQFHFTAWPDKGVPSNVNSILEFREKVMSKTDITGPIVVHCSAGIGRTGTFIALDYLIKQGQRDGSVDVVSCVSRMRHQRAHAIQTVEQYKYLYDVITKALTGHQSSLLIDEFRPYLKNAKFVNPSTGNRNVVEEFQLIEKLTPEFDERRYQASKAFHNKQKNRHNNILADDNYRVHLCRGETDYINAIQLSDAQGRAGYVVTQTPLPNTTRDFLTLVAEQEVFCIVKLDDEMDETVGIYWPTRDAPILSKPFDLFLLDKTEFGKIEVSSLQFHEKKTGNLRPIQLFHGRFWKDNHLVPEDHQPMIDLIETVLNCRKERNGHPVVVHCMTGAQRSGLFCVLANIVEQIQLFGTVDIMQTVLNARHRRSQIVSCVEHLEYIFDFVETYLDILQN
ncbi:receptor-type tyrosine-protein phosphatase alpha-like isoform X3 [Ostrea edulis]|uniref:receptor-type tyrosine-protein phosphatase alpha-like isoform X3 n=1 Tax=Ostrea edulis TaxID=37623 RepID=UPI0024AF4AB2|nr:receptor-type tyrosine-protein phosphatase alpha-like isoform X3 [Ostrea edulis]